MAQSNDQAGTADCPAGELTLETAMARHEPALLRYAARLLRNAEAAQDVVQDTFIRLHRNWGPRFQGGDHVAHWLYRTAHNCAVDFIRRESRLKKLHDTAAVEPAVGLETVAPPQGPDPAEERRQLALEHLAGLEPPERQVLLLRLQEGLSYRDISRVTGRSEGNVGCLLHHATKKLTASLKKAGVIGS